MSSYGNKLGFVANKEETSGDWYCYDEKRGVNITALSVATQHPKNTNTLTRRCQYAIYAVVDGKDKIQCNWGMVNNLPDGSRPVCGVDGSCLEYIKHRNDEPDQSRYLYITPETKQISTEVKPPKL